MDAVDALGVLQREQRLVKREQKEQQQQKGSAHRGVDVKALEAQSESKEEKEEKRTQRQHQQDYQGQGSALASFFFGSPLSAALPTAHEQKEYEKNGEEADAKHTDDNLQGEVAKAVCLSCLQSRSRAISFLPLVFIFSSSLRFSNSNMREREADAEAGVDTSRDVNTDSKNLSK